MNAFTTVTFLSTTLLISTNLAAKEVKNFYINGINNTRTQATDSAKKLKDGFDQKYSYILNNTEVNIAYNESFGLVPDLIESGIQKYDLEDLVSGLAYAGLMEWSENQELLSTLSDAYQRELLVKSVHFHLLMNDENYRNKLYESIVYLENHADILLTGAGSTYPPQVITEDEIRTFDKLAFLLDLGFSVADLMELKLVSHLSSIHSDIAMSLRHYYDNIGEYINQLEATQEQILSQFNPVLTTGGAINLVAHSQGNFFANQILSDLQQPENTRLLSVGSPDHHLPETGSFVNLREDTVVRAVKPNLGWNFSNINDNIWNNNIIQGVIIEEMELAYYNQQENLDKQGHNFITAYMKPDSDSKEAIIDTMAQHYIELEGDTIQFYGQADNDYSCSLLLETQLPQRYEEFESRFYNQHCYFYYQDEYVVDYDIALGNTSVVIYAHSDEYKIAHYEQMRTYISDSRYIRITDFNNLINDRYSFSTWMDQASYKFVLTVNGYPQDYYLILGRYMGITNQTNHTYSSPAVLGISLDLSKLIQKIEQGVYTDPEVILSVEKILPDWSNAISL